MNDFKSYNPQGDKNDKQQLNSTVDFANAVVKAMSGKSEGQLWKTIIAEAERGKREGRLSNADLENFYNMVSPMVDGAKRKKLKEIIAKLKNI